MFLGTRIRCNPRCWRLGAFSWACAGAWRIRERCRVGRLDVWAKALAEGRLGNADGYHKLWSPDLGYNAAVRCCWLGWRCRGFNRASALAALAALVWLGLSRRSMTARYGEFRRRATASYGELRRRVTARDGAWRRRGWLGWRRWLGWLGLLGWLGWLGLAGMA